MFLDCNRISKCSDDENIIPGYVSFFSANFKTFKIDFEEIKQNDWKKMNNFHFGEAKSP